MQLSVSRIKFMYTHDPGIPLVDTLLREILPLVHREGCTRKSVTVLFVVPGRVGPGCPSLGSEWAPWKQLEAVGAHVTPWMEPKT